MMLIARSPKTHRLESPRRSPKLRQIAPILVLALSLPFLQGCAALLVGGVAAGATYGTIQYSNNTLKVTFTSSLDKVWTAANGAIKDLRMPTVSIKKDAVSALLTSRTAADQAVSIQLKKQSESVTEVHITVGTFDSTSNRAVSQQIHDKIKARL